MTDQGSQLAPSPRSAPRTLLKRVETHVRLYSHLENFSVSSSSTSLQLRVPPASDSQSPSEKWSSPYEATRVHRGTPTTQFYDEVIAPCVANCTSGQSYLFLTSGPPESGRSHTLYGSPHHSEKGLVELTAEDLLRRVAARQKTMLQASATASVSADKENIGVSSAVNTDNASEPLSGGMVVTYAAFTTHEDTLTDTLTGGPVRLEEFPPPLGLTPLPEVRLLEEASSAVALPKKKLSGMSCVVQFYVYAPVGTSGRRSMATLTFVDVTAFSVPLCKELQHLLRTVECVAGTAPEGAVADFKKTKLTTLLEPALQGYTTLVSITTISGRPEIFESVKAALEFSGTLGQIHQMLTLIHIQNPRWFVDAAQGIESLKELREKSLAEHYALGVYDYYKTACRWLVENVDNVDAQLDRILEETDQVRRGIASEVSNQHREVYAKVEAEEGAVREETQRVKAVEEKYDEVVDRLHAVESEVVQLEEQAHHGDLHCERKIEDIKAELSGLENTNHTLIEERQQLEKESSLYHQKTEEIQTMLNAYAEELQYVQGMTNCVVASQQLSRKRARLEEDLRLAAQVVQSQSGASRVGRERQSRLTRLTSVQQRVEQLREATRSNSADPAKLKYRSYSSGGGNRRSKA